MDSSNFSQLLVYVRYSNISEIFIDFSFCQTLIEKATANDIFILNIYLFFESWELSLTMCKAILTDNAAKL